MPLHEYKCPAGHLTERLVSVRDKDEPKETIQCEHTVKNDDVTPRCGLIAERLAPRTGTPILKPGGVGGFYKPSRA